MYGTISRMADEKSPLHWGDASRRLINKDGSCNVRHLYLPQHHKPRRRNWFHLVIEAKWRWILGVFALCYLASWLLFGFLFYAICFAHGDFDQSDDNETIASGGFYNSAAHEPCVRNLKTLVSAFLFSYESQHTIGYGFRFVTEECVSVILTLWVQSLVGVLIQTMLGGIILAKILRPKHRQKQIIFSKNALIVQHDGKPMLNFRIADISAETHVVEAHIRLYFIDTHTTTEGDRQALRITDMNVGYDWGWDRVLILWPFAIHHAIDEHSPLGPFAGGRSRAPFELVALVEGIVESTGMTFQARTSYLPDEILHGFHFVDTTAKDPLTGRLTVIYANFDKLRPASSDDSQNAASEDELATALLDVNA